ncbi:GNAT family protein [Bacillus sp. RO1]|uniref:GNAT family N-acetyltransferase n=1 Tax=Bacillus sp. RO1 TaxID=2722703 RepID=UPI001456F695|nr:GNAT family protein [Bacillus sp. RO1]NLP52911.1 GNAT family N-acetyltransferase [Bacillus sp. RO1]
MLIREIEIEDAENLINLIKEVEGKSNFMLMEAGERKTTHEQQRKHLERLGQQNNSTIFVAEQEGNLIGYLIAVGGSVKRTKHSAYIVVGILEQNRGQGVGTVLFKYIDEWAKSHHITRLELTAVTKNEAGVALYKKSGFEIEGTKRNSLMIDGTFYDEYYMSKLITF